jgi:hypothetical protein
MLRALAASAGVSRRSITAGEAAATMAIFPLRLELSGRIAQASDASGLLAKIRHGEAASIRKDSSVRFMYEMYVHPSHLAHDFEASRAGVACGQSVGHSDSGNNLRS